MDKGKTHPFPVFRHLGCEGLHGTLGCLLAQPDAAAQVGVVGVQCDGQLTGTRLQQAHQLPGLLTRLCQLLCRVTAYRLGIGFMFNSFGHGPLLRLLSLCLVAFHFLTRLCQLLRSEE